MLFYMLGKTDVGHLKKRIMEHVDRNKKAKVKILAEVIVVGKPWLVSIFDADRKEDIIEFISPHLKEAEFDIYPAVDIKKAYEIYKNA